MSIKKLVIATGLALAFGTNAQAAEIINSRTGLSSPAPTGVPSGAIIFNPDPSEIVPKEQRSLSCAQFYGASPSNISYSGGPRIEYRFEDGYEKDADGNFIKDTDGNFVKAYTPWAYESGECFRNHTYTRDTTACPTNQAGVITEERKYTITDGDEMINDTDWVEINRTCDYYYVDSGSETQTRACPSNQKGIYTDRRTFDNWSDGSRRNISAWTLIGNTCAYYHVSNGTEYRNVACPGSQRGAHQQRRTFQNWSDGSKRAYSGWVTHSNSCAYYHVNNGSETRNRACPSGYTGNYVDRRTFQNWSDGSRRAYSAWTLYQNKCVLARICTPGSTKKVKYSCHYNHFRCNSAGTEWVYTHETDSCGHGN